MDINRAMRNPASVFGTPEAVSESREITTEQKRAILLQWQNQLQQFQAADDEGMPSAAGTSGELLGRVTSLLSRLTP